MTHHFLFYFSLDLEYYEYYIIINIILTTQFSLSVISFGNCAILRSYNLLFRVIRVLEAIFSKVGNCLL